MENQVKVVTDGQGQETSNKAKELGNTSEACPDQATEINVDKQPKLIKDAPESEESKQNNRNGTDELAQNGGSITSPLGNIDVLNNGFLAAKSPRNGDNIETVNGTSALESNSNASSVDVDQKNLLAADAQHPETTAKESLEKTRDPQKTGKSDGLQSDSSQQTNILTEKSSENVAAIESSDYDEQTMAALLQEAVLDEIVPTVECGEYSQSTKSSETNLFKAAINEFSERGGIPATLPDSQTDESVMVKSILKGKAFQKFIQTLDDQLDKAFSEENETSQGQSGEAAMIEENQNSKGNENAIYVQAGSVLPEKNTVSSC